MERNSNGRISIRILSIGLPAALMGAVVGAGAWLVTSQGDAEAASGKPVARKAPASKPASALGYNRAFNNVYFKVPDDYRAVQQDGGIVMARASDIEAGEITGFIVITPGIPIGPKEREALRKAGKDGFVQAMAINAGNLESDPNAKISKPELANDPAKDGYEGYYLVSRSQDADAQKERFTQYAVFLTRDRVEIAMRFGYGSEARLKAFGPGFDAVLKSMEFKNMGAPAPARLAAALPNSLEALTPKAEAAPSAPRSSGQAQASRSNEQGLSCKNEPRLRRRPNARVYCPDGSCSQGPAVTTYYGSAYVCRKNGQVVSER